MRGLKWRKSFFRDSRDTYPLLVLAHADPAVINDITDSVMRAGGQIASTKDLKGLRRGRDSEAVIGPGRMLITMGSRSLMMERLSDPDWYQDCYDRGRIIVMPFLGRNGHAPDITRLVNQLVISIPVRFTCEDPEIP